jgi:hypothetical protein
MTSRAKPTMAMIARKTASFAGSGQFRIIVTPSIDELA